MGRGRKTIGKMKIAKGKSKWLLRIGSCCPLGLKAESSEVSKLGRSWTVALLGCHSLLPLSRKPGATSPTSAAEHAPEVSVGEDPWQSL